MSQLNGGSSDRNNRGIFPRIIAQTLKLLFHLLYNQFAWAYDWVADAVSLAQWQSWVLSVLPYLDPSPILELGPGPGHLQKELRLLEYKTFGVDPSVNMASIAYRRLQKHKFEPGLIVGRSQQLPYPDQSFKHVVSTFPSDYINDVETLREIWRVLEFRGELIVLIAAWLTGERWYEKLVAWIFQITGQVPDSDQIGIIDQGFYHLSEAAEIGFQLTPRIVELERSQVMIIKAQKMIS